MFALNKQLIIRMVRYIQQGSKDLNEERPASEKTFLKDYWKEL